MKVKVCGLNNQENILGLKQTNLDFMGFIFYEESKRSVSKGDIDREFVKSINNVQKVGVFVDMALEEVQKVMTEYHLNFTQLHGNETPEYCGKMKKNGFKVIKAISISNKLPVDMLRAYQRAVDLFLFDTSGVDKGGNGTKFDWAILKDYNLDVPFLLAGGISSDDAIDVRALDLKMLYGVDINSKFEITPGKKDINKVKQFIEEIK